MAVERCLHGRAHQTAQTGIIERPAVDHVPLERKAGIVVPGRRRGPRLEPPRQPRHRAEPLPEPRADLLCAPFTPDHDHLAGVSAHRAGLERKDARVLGAE